MVYYVLFWFIHKVYIVKIPLLKQFNIVFRNSQSIVFANDFIEYGALFHVMW